MKNVKVWAIALAALLVGALVLQNTESVETRLLFLRVEMPRAVLLFITFLAGAVVGLFAGSRLRDRSAPGESGEQKADAGS